MPPPPSWKLSFCHWNYVWYFLLLTIAGINKHLYNKIHSNRDLFILNFIKVSCLFPPLVTLLAHTSSIKTNDVHSHLITSLIFDYLHGLQESNLPLLLSDVLICVIRWLICCMYWVCNINYTRNKKNKNSIYDYISLYNDVQGFDTDNKYHRTPHKWHSWTSINQFWIHLVSLPYMHEGDWK